MYGDETAFGLVFITGKEYTIYKATKTNSHFDCKKITSSTTRLPNKQKKGGQSAPRFQRLRLEAIEAYIKKVSEDVVASYMRDNNTIHTVSRLVILGPSSKKTLLSESSLVRQYFSGKIVTVDAEILDYSKLDSIFEDAGRDENQLGVDRINELLAIADDRLLFGVDEINEGKGDVAEVITDKDTMKRLKVGDKCKITIIDKDSLDRIGIRCLGLKWY